MVVFVIIYFCHYFYFMKFPAYLVARVHCAWYIITAVGILMSRSSGECDPGFDFF